MSEAHPSDKARAAAASGWQLLLRFSLGGPALLTEDRQKPRCLLDGLHGTRTTVPSIAVAVAKPCIPLRSRRASEHASR